MKITPWFTYPQSICVYKFILSGEYSRSYIKKCPGFIMAINGCRDFEAQKSASIHQKNTPQWFFFAISKTRILRYAYILLHPLKCHSLVNMDIFHTQTHHFASEGFVVLYGTLLMMDGCTFLGFKISNSIHCHYKAWKSQEFFYITQIIFVRKKKVIHT